MDNPVKLNETYKSIVVTARGGPEVLKIAENHLRLPEPIEVRIKVLAAPVCAPDISSRYGQSPFVPKPPFTPGYAVIGKVDAIGDEVNDTSVGDMVGALMAYGGYAEYAYWNSKELIPVPETINLTKAAPIILNYIVAYHVIHRWAKSQAGDKVLIIGASGGIGTALLELGKLAHLKMYGLASAKKHPILTEYGAIPIDYKTQDFVEVLKQAEPEGLNAVFDGMAGEYFRRGFSVLARGGTLVGYGNPLSLTGVLKMLSQVALFTLLPNEKSAKYYSTGVLKFNRSIFQKDWATLFSMLESGKINPIIMKKFPILEAKEANELLESGDVIGSIVLLAPELL
jgi:NADPH:quinone reductase-like Zn-dependent oxidoreductase